MKSRYIFSLVILGIGTIFLGVVGGVVVSGLLSPDDFWMGFGVGSIIGFGASISLLIFIDEFFFDILPERKTKPKHPWTPRSQGNIYEKVEKVEVKDDYKNLDWLRHQYYDLGKSIQNIADVQGVSMITIKKWIDKIEKR